MNQQQKSSKPGQSSRLRMNRPKTEVWKFAWRHRSCHIILTCCAALVATFLVLLTYSNGSVGWWNWLEPVVGVGTLGVALAVWLGELRQDWENSLLKRLTVNFLYQGREYMRCEGAYLAGEADIRAWGQQLGSQMAGSPLLRFQPNILQQPGTVTRDRYTGSHYMHYRVTFFLTQLPHPHRDSSGEILNARELAFFTQGRQCVWKYCSREKSFLEKKWFSIPAEPDQIKGSVQGKPAAYNDFF